MEHQSSSDSSRFTWIITLGVIVLIILPVYFGAPLLAKRDFAATAKLRISPVKIPNATNGVGASIVNQSFIEGELGRILSVPAMTDVLNKLRPHANFKLTDIPPQASVPEAVDKLRRLVTLRQMRASQVVEIRTHTPDPQLSADIANEIAQTYMRGLQTRTNHFRVSLIQWASADARR